MSDLPPADGVPPYSYEKPYSDIASAKNVIQPEYALGDILLLPNNPLQGNTPYQPQDKAAFSPLPREPFSIEGALLLGVILTFAKTPEGQKSLERIIVKYLDSCARMVESVQDACHSNWLTALNNQHITAAIGHKIGLIDDAGYVKILDHYRSVFDKMFAIALVGDTITGVTTLVQGAKVQTAAAAGASPETSSGLAALTNILGKAMG